MQVLWQGWLSARSRWANPAGVWSVRYQWLRAAYGLLWTLLKQLATISILYLDGSGFNGLRTEPVPKIFFASRPTSPADLFGVFSGTFIPLFRRLSTRTVRMIR